ncbi:hypothetical protein CVT24_001159 [Panaeolus cyanescens]|uniref:GH16 domain-containing protein n=1 Tax=Panaeolus cyanescens TaxID=181874 RepID=A0A409YZ24_9AGAR|nr:hypothetical protein CVT24_001159 [Panaeolus cyanescens]
MARGLASLRERWGIQAKTSVLSPKDSNTPESSHHVKRQTTAINYNKNGSAFVWVPQDTYQGKSFFDGLVKYVSREVALAKNYTWVEDDGTARIVADMKSWLPFNTSRESVRINTKKLYTTGLFIIDLNRAPYGCAVWPAFWSTSIPRSNLPQDKWPNYGEIDVLEGVHDQQTNRMAWHTKAGCYINKNVSFTGSVSKGGNNQELLDCESNGTTKGGCGITDWSKASYGRHFESLGGGVLAMKWDENDISVWSFFRAAIPDDIRQGVPTPASWGPPSARLDSSNCDIKNYFSNHTIIISEWILKMRVSISYGALSAHLIIFVYIYHYQNYHVYIYFLNLCRKRTARIHPLRSRYTRKVVGPLRVYPPNQRVYHFSTADIFFFFLYFHD